MASTTIRCAVYTRKSSDEGLDQSFNSLDAQHEACAAYIASQKHEGWKLLPTRYDDGGVSGGTLERPALQRLIADIEARRVDMVVVYKIDRLTRSLADFAKLVERLEACDCSFVSVTQAFNTSSSMGRLTLNVLLSFAQFEREVTAERIRDKIAASKKKGLWMGGLAPIGYDPHPDPTRRELVVNESEAETVRTIFALYRDKGCLNAVTRAATDLGLRSKLRTFASGRTQGGSPFSRGQVYALLRNPVYLGRIRHRDQDYEGTHPAIVDADLWHDVQRQLEQRAGRRRGDSASSDAAPLTGKLRDDTGDRLTPTSTRKQGRLHRYYVSNRIISGKPDPSAWRLPARELERVINAAIASHLENLANGHRLLAEPDATQLSEIAGRLREAARKIAPGCTGDAASLVASGTLGRRQIDLRLCRTALARELDLEPAALADHALAVSAPFELRRRGVETRIVTGDRAPEADRSLLEALRRAERWSAEIISGRSAQDIADREHCSPRHVLRTAHLSGLSPRIKAAILDGTQPLDLTLDRLIRDDIPLDYRTQDARYGLDSRVP